LRGHGDKCTKKSIAGILGNVAELGAHRLGKRFVVRADEKLSAFVELERQVLTVTFYLASIPASDQ